MKFTETEIEWWSPGAAERGSEELVFNGAASVWEDGKSPSGGGWW